jgi:hypothetical protein
MIQYFLGVAQLQDRDKAMYKNDFTMADLGVAHIAHTPWHTVFFITGTLKDCALIRKKSLQVWVIHSIQIYSQE